MAHSAFETEAYPHAERAYGRVLELMEEGDETRTAVVDNLAASIYQQGARASSAEDHRGAAGHFLRIAEVAPDSEIRATAEYDAGASLILVEDWDGAVRVLAGDYTLQNRSMLDVEVMREGRKQAKFRAFNDVVIAKVMADYPEFFNRLKTYKVDMKKKGEKNKKEN